MVYTCIYKSKLIQNRLVQLSKVTKTKREQAEEVVLTNEMQYYTIQLATNNK